MDRAQAMLENAKAGFVAQMYDRILLTERAKHGYALFFKILLTQEEGAVFMALLCRKGQSRPGIRAVAVCARRGQGNHHGGLYAIKRGKTSVSGIYGETEGL